MLGDARLASVFADQMLGNFNGSWTRTWSKSLIVFSDFSAEKGIYVIGFSYPVVPKDKARIRVQISAAHTEEQIDQCVNAFVEVGKKLNVVNWKCLTRRNCAEIWN